MRIPKALQLFNIYTEDELSLGLFAGAAGLSFGLALGETSLMWLLLGWLIVITGTWGYLVQQRRQK